MFDHNVFIKVSLLSAFLALLLLSVPTSAQIDNCCQVDRECTTEAEWISGWYAYFNNQCVAPSQQSQQSQQSHQTQPSQQTQQSQAMGDQNGSWSNVIPIPLTSEGPQPLPDDWPQPQYQPIPQYNSEAVTRARDAIMEAIQKHQLGRVITVPDIG